MTNSNDGSGWDPFSSIPAPTPIPTPQPPVASPQWGAPGPDIQFSVTPNGGIPSDVPLAADVPLEPPTPAKSGKGRKIGLGVGVAALLAAGGFAVFSIAGSGSNGGAESPEAAVRELLAAASAEDALGAMDLVLPSERDTFRQPMIDMVTELGRIEVLDPTFDLAKVGGVDLQFNVTDLIVDSDVAEDIANVSISGSSTLTVEGESIPLGDYVLDKMGGAPPDADETTEFEDDVITTVQRDGRWYVSMWYSVAEAARRDADAGPVPAIADGLRPVGGKTAEEGMTAFLNAVTELDLETMMTSLNPREAEALHRYAPLFIDDAQRSINAGVEDVSITIEDLAYRVTEIDKNRVGIFPTAFTVEAGEENIGEATLTLANGCLVVEFVGDGMEENFNSCDLATGQTDTEAMDALEEQLGPEGVEAFTNLGETVRDAMADAKFNGITMEKIDGEWFISPMGTYFDTMLAVLRALDRSEIEAIEKAGGEAFETFSSGLFGVPPDDEFPDNEFPDNEFPDNEFPEDDLTDDPSFEAMDKCMFESDSFAETQRCLQDGIGAGVIDEADVPVTFLHACGLGEAQVDGDLYTLPDDTFIELLTSARECFLAAGVDEESLPSEVSKIECYKGVNVYNSPDEDAITEYFDCVFG